MEHILCKKLCIFFLKWFSLFFQWEWHFHIAQSRWLHIYGRFNWQRWSPQFDRICEEIFSKLIGATIIRSWLSLTTTIHRISSRRRWTKKKLVFFEEPHLKPIFLSSNSLNQNSFVRYIHIYGCCLTKSHM